MLALQEYPSKYITNQHTDNKGLLQKLVDLFLQYQRFVRT